MNEKEKAKYKLPLQESYSEAFKRKVVMESELAEAGRMLDLAYHGFHDRFSSGVQSSALRVGNWLEQHSCVSSGDPAVVSARRA